MCRGSGATYYSPRNRGTLSTSHNAVGGKDSIKPRFLFYLKQKTKLRKDGETHAARITEIQELLVDYGIEAERHSISRDIKDLMELLNKDQETLMEDRDLLNYEVEYDTSLHGYKVVRRPYEFDNLVLAILHNFLWC